jgi:hypothetical protein
MRRYLTLGIAIGMAGVVFAAIALAQVNVNHSTVKGVFSPSTIPTGTFKGGKLHVTDTTVYATNGGTPQNPTKEPDPTTHVDQFFDNSAKITVNAGLPSCTEAALTNTTTAQAEAACGPGSGNNAELTLNKDGTVNRGTAVACVAAGTGTPCANLAQGVVTAFNGNKLAQGTGRCTSAPTGGCPTILLHTRVGAPLNVTLVLVGVVNKTSLLDFGYRLDVPVDPLAGFASALTYFDVTVQRKWTLSGHNYNYLKATCNDADSKWNYRADYTYHDGSPPATETAVSTQNCTAS